MEDIISTLTFTNIKSFILDNNLIGFVLTILITFFLAKFVKKMLVRGLAKVTTPTEKTNYQFFRHVLVALVYIIGFTAAIYNVPAFKAVGATVLAGAGVFALAISFASQQALSNIVSGVFIIVFKPFKIGDRITMKSAGYDGIVEDITLRHTVIRSYENRRVIVPNSIISNETITNSDYGDPKVCKHLVIGVGYNSDIDLAKKIINEEAENHPFSIDNRTSLDISNGVPKVVVRVMQLGESSVDIKAWIWVSDQGSVLEMVSDLNQSIKKRFDESGILIPYPHRTIEMIQAS